MAPTWHVGIGAVNSSLTPISRESDPNFPIQSQAVLIAIGVTFSSAAASLKLRCLPAARERPQPALVATTCP